MENRNTLYKMTKTVTHIDCPKEWESDNDWDSHRPMLYLAASNTSKPICEFGCGFGSTLLLRNHCKKYKLFFSSYETNPEYAGKFNCTTRINDYDEIYLSGGEFSQGLLFIDSAPGLQRKDLINKHANHADVIVVHDSEKSSQFCYDLEPTLSKFKYRLDYEPIGKPHTTVVSNEINVCDWV